MVTLFVIMLTTLVDSVFVFNQAITKKLFFLFLLKIII